MTPTRLAVPQQRGNGERTPAAALDLLLRRHAGAVLLGAVAGTVPQPTPVPPALAPAGARITEPQLADLTDDDRFLMAQVWNQARVRGTATAPVRLAGRAGQMYAFDMRAEHGVVLIAFVPGAPDGEMLRLAAPLHALRPRFARASRDARAAFRWVEPALGRMLALDAASLVGRSATELVHPDDLERGIAGWVAMLEQPGRAAPIRLRHRRGDGGWVWLEVTNTNRLRDPAYGDVLSELADVSAEMAAHEAVQAREQLLAQVAEAVPVGLFHAAADGTLLFANGALRQITGQDGVGTLDEQWAGVSGDEAARLQEALAAARAGVPADVEVRVQHAGGLRHCRVRLRPLSGELGEVSGVTGCVEDVTDAVRSRRDLEARAATDPLTGCLNRDAGLAVLQKVLDGLAPGAGVAVLFLDLDGFKPVNDERGHAAGDALLAAVAERLRTSLRPNDSIVRVGGDEFLLVCPQVPGPAEALVLARGVTRRAFARPFDRAGTRLRASVGVAWQARRGASAAHLVHAADAAMYRSKRDGRGRAVLAPAVRVG